MLQVFEDGKLSHFIDGRGSSGNWMAHVNTARYAQEQNLVATQCGAEIYYEACKDITQVHICKREYPTYIFIMKLKLLKRNASNSSLRL